MEEEATSRQENSALARPFLERLGCKKAPALAYRGFDVALWCADQKGRPENHWQTVTAFLETIAPVFSGRPF